MSVTAALAALRDEYETFARVQVVFDETAPPTSDILIQLPDLGLCLRFEPTGQLLRRIDFWPSKCLAITFKGRVVIKPGVDTQCEGMHHMFGPCCGEEYDRASKAYLLKYPGVIFGFAVSPEVLREHRKSGDINLQHHSGKFPDGSVATLSCGAVVTGVEMKAGPPASATPPMRVRARPAAGLVFEGGRQLRFGDAAQEVVAKFGPPCSTFRPGDSPWIGGARHSKGVFFNYRRFGFDVYFDPRRHRIAKFVLHANAPGHFDFGVYTKCNFTCEVRAPTRVAGDGAVLTDAAGTDDMLRSCIDHQPGWGTGLDRLPPLRPAPARDLLDEAVSDGDSFRSIAVADSGSEDNLLLGDLDSPSPHHGLQGGGSRATAMLVTPETKWDQVLRRCKMAKPVTTQPPPAPNTINPYGVTHLYNDGPFVFETVPVTGRIATVTFFQQPPQA